MKKETLVAIGLGGILGMASALIIIFSIKEKNIKAKKVITPKITPTIKLSFPKIQPLTIIEPQSEYLTKKDLVTIKGKGGKGSLVIIQSQTTEKVVKLTGNNFSLDFPLSLGENLIKITSYQKNNVEEKNLKIYYLKE